MPTLRALGFCGADDSVDPNLLAIYSRMYPVIEFGVLFRPDKAGTPRYASDAWVQRLVKVRASCDGFLQLAAHLCGSRVNEVLTGDDAFLVQLSQWGFRRVQINATQVNGVDTSRLAQSVPDMLSSIVKHPELEFILQKNEETQPLWQGLLHCAEPSSGGVDRLPSNVSMLVDESKGTGMLASSWPRPPTEYRIGYAGGIGPSNAAKVLDDIVKVGSDATTTNGEETSFWIDMESSLRSIKNDKDVFDLDKCYEVVQATCAAGLMQHPEFLKE
uniref:Phosphoribosylanthranilate isomerase n=1 Tax=Craspedostauros australis TaxID=1486917 RepID=A0A7R9WXQ3_9STRA|mmetsp:Transcript_23785/g.66436  ORF Transcript_23785/g.66436 Transcript_23785/m.66436 type:complete len:273 (+) Transcript_23785:97-915(+)